MTNILVTGADGQLGMELQAIAKDNSNYRFIFTNRHSLDITQEAALESFFKENEINFCINCAAYTAVDKAEEEIDLAMKINGESVGKLARCCTKYEAKLIHISTDYVFDGNAAHPYKVNHKTNPVNYYGRTKLVGEQLAMQYNSEAIIIRTSWVYSNYGNNFVKTMLRLMEERQDLSIVDDQHGCPTYAADLAAVIIKIINHPQWQAGIYHYCNDGETTWFQFAQAIKELAGKTCDLIPISTAQFPTPATRPVYSSLFTGRICKRYEIEIPFWKDSLKNCLQQAMVTGQA